MRLKQISQSRLDFPTSNLKLPIEYYEQFQQISAVLDQNPKILELIHQDLKDALAVHNRIRKGKARRFQYTSEQVLRIIICRKIEGLPYRRIIIRIDDSKYLRQFTRIYEGPMMDFTTLNKLESAIRPKTWKAINEALTTWAISQEKISGEAIRLDTTATETNIHHPTDSWLLWDLYRVLARLIEYARDVDSEAVGTRRLQTRRAKKLHHRIAREAGKKKSREILKPHYDKLLGLVEPLCAWSKEVVVALMIGLEQQRYGLAESYEVEAIIAQMGHFLALSGKVIDQAHRRVQLGETVHNDDKIFSIFEEHTELLKRGKAKADVEFGHMVLIGQVGGKFITYYDVFDKKPVEYKLLNPALESHKKLFGCYPDQLAADKGFYENMDAIGELEQIIETVAIGKKGKRDAAQTEREHSAEFRLGQRFRAGVEGTISFLKRTFGMFRVLRKGWEHFVAEIGAAIFAHNLLILARG